MKITVCIGSDCHIKGSRKILEQLQYLVKQKGLEGKISIGGTFCMGNCQQGVCVTADGKVFSVTYETVEAFFEEEVLAKVSR